MQRRLLGPSSRHWTIHFDYSGFNFDLGQYTSEQWKSGADRHSVENNIDTIFEQQQVGYSRNKPGNLRSGWPTDVRSTVGCTVGCTIRRCPSGPAPRRRVLTSGGCFAHGLQQPHRRLLFLVTALP